MATQSTDQQIVAWVFPDPGWHRRVAGLTLIDRLCKVLEREKIRDVRYRLHRGDVEAATRLLVFRGPQVITLPWLQAFRRLLTDDDQALVAGDAQATIYFVGARLVDPMLTYEYELSSLPLHSVDVLHAERMAVGSDEDAERAVTLLFRGVWKPTDSPLTSALNHIVSAAVTKPLLDTPVTPNQLTVFCCGIGVIGGVLLAVPSYVSSLLGASLFQLSSWLDGCDGELARLRFQESRLGGWLDFLGDNVVHCVIFGGIAVGQYRLHGSGYWLWLGAVAISGVVVSVILVSWRMRRNDGSFTSVLGDDVAMVENHLAFQLKVSDFLARRDFTYLLLIAAVIGRVEWFLYLAAIGAPLYAVNLVVLYARTAR